MLHFLLPRCHPELHKALDCQPLTHPEPVISNSLSHYLYDIKRRIDAQEDQWDVCKRYTNPYEYIHTAVPGKRKSVSKHKPLSRSYFKMIEMVQFFHVVTSDRKPLAAFHLAEGPGGFIEALADMRRCSRDKYVGMTIEESPAESRKHGSDSGVPGWRKSHYFLQEHRDTVSIEKGADGTGDILSMANLNHCIAKYGGWMNLMTGDGGFDFSTNFNDQEIHITRLLFAQLVYAVCLQKPGGAFILKVFDCFMPQTLDCLAILSSLYEKVYLTKPQTSRYANSEKYVVCKGFLGVTTEVRNDFVRVFGQMLSATEIQAFRFLNRELPLVFLSRMEEYNAIFGQQQIENIYYTLSLMDCYRLKQDKVDALIKANVQKCMHWCIKFGVAHHVLLANSAARSEDIDRVANSAARSEDIDRFANSAARSEDIDRVASTTTELMTNKNGLR